MRPLDHHETARRLDAARQELFNTGRLIHAAFPPYPVGERLRAVHSALVSALEAENALRRALDALHATNSGTPAESPYFGLRNRENPVPKRTNQAEESTSE